MFQCCILGNVAFRKEEGPDCRDSSCGSAVKVHYTMLFQWSGQRRQRFQFSTIFIGMKTRLLNKTIMMVFNSFDHQLSQNTSTSIRNVYREGTDESETHWNRIDMAQK